MTPKAQIAGTGSYLPKQCISNTDLEKQVDTTDAWITERTGIRQRYIVGEGEGTASMASIAAQRALKSAGLSKVDMIIVATTTPDCFFPSTACFVQAQLGLKECAAFDVAAACAGFNYALATAEQFIRTGQVQSVLVIGSETMSRVLDWNDRSTCVLFGDGAGAVVLTAGEKPGILSCHLHADGQYQDLLYVNNFRTSDSTMLKIDPLQRTIKMEGQAIFKLAVERLGDTLLKILKENNLQASDVDWFIPHQANLRIIKSLAKRLKLPESRVIITIDQHANTSSASVPLALDLAIREGRIQRGQCLLLESFGGGIVWGSALIRY